MLNKKYRKALTEVYLILQMMQKEEINKIPDNLLTFISKNKDNNYTPKFDNALIKDIPLLPESKGLLGFLYAKYWSKSEEDKTEFIELLKQNEYKYRKD